MFSSVFPVDAVLPQLMDALPPGGRALLTAPPGSGKTTRVPLALLEMLNQRGESGTILMLEPRRLATRNAARFMAKSRQEPVGQTIGYRVRLESNVSPRTRIELVTEGILTRRLISDPELQGVACIIFDEFHERHIQGDLGLALCLEAQEVFRPDLRLLVMSATLNVAPLQVLLGNCPHIEAAGQLWPVDICHVPSHQALSPRPPLQELAQKTSSAIQSALYKREGDLLVFLPGTREIRETAQALHHMPLPSSIHIHPLYGDLSFSEQDAALAPAPPGQRKIVLSTSIAESSLTIEGIRTVVDCGLRRTARFDPASGMNRLVTERISQAGADQRAGRAGRLEPGFCYRLWQEGIALLPHPRPEIEEADLAPLLLYILVWGAQAHDLAWLTPPPPVALELAAHTLQLLGAASQDEQGGWHSTAHGEFLARLPLHPRLGHMLSQAPTLATKGIPPSALVALAACVAALVEEGDPLRGRESADIRLRLSAFRQGNGRLVASAKQIYGLCSLTEPFTLPVPELEAYAGPLVSLAWPERMAQSLGKGIYRLASGQQVRLDAHDPLSREPWLAVATANMQASHSPSAFSRIYLAAPLAIDDMRQLHGEQITFQTLVQWDRQTEAVVARSQHSLGSLVLEESPAPPRPETTQAIKQAVLTGIAQCGLECLPWTPELRQWQARVELLSKLDDPNYYPWPDVSNAALLASLARDPEQEENWLAPWLEGIHRRSQFSRIPLPQALHSLLPWELAQRLEKETPTLLEVPSGSLVPVDYTAPGGPVLAVKLQEMFGAITTPTIASNRMALTLHLLSPAGRPLQVTQDLPHFWNHAYGQVRAEMRGRYPKHPWPEDPFTALPTRKTKRAMGS